MKTFLDFGIDVPSHATGDVKTFCPQCSETRKHYRDPCLSVNVDEGIWNCHHCAWTGTLREKSMKKSYRRPTSIAVAETPDDITQFFRERGISAETVERNKITATAVWMPQSGEEESVIAFPYYRNGELINVKYRGRDKSFRMEKDAELILYGLDDIDATVIIVEGELDKLAVEEAGFRSCISVPNGAPPADAKNYAAKLDYLGSADFSKVKTFILAVDNDAPGRRPGQESKPISSRSLSVPENPDLYSFYHPKDCWQLLSIAVYAHL